MPWQTKCGLAYFDTQKKKKIKSFLILMCTNCLVQTLKYTETLMAEKKTMYRINLSLYSTCNI